MAADRATVSISASLLPDEIKTSVGGITVYDLDDLGNNNKWIYSLTLISSVEDLIKAGSTFIGQGATEEGASTVTHATDDVHFLFVKHSGTTNGSDPTSSTLAVNIASGSASGTTVGDVIIKPNECFFARIGAAGTEIQDVNAVSSSGTIQVQVWAIIDDGGE